MPPHMAQCLLCCGIGVLLDERLSCRAHEFRDQEERKSALQGGESQHGKERNRQQEIQAGQGKGTSEAM